MACPMVSDMPGCALTSWTAEEVIRHKLDGRVSYLNFSCNAFVARYRVSHGIGPTLFFAILSVSTLPKYKNLVSVKKFRKFAIR